MKGRPKVGILLTAAFLLLLVTGVGHAQGPVAPESPGEPDAPLGTRFLYQGQIKHDDSPVDDTCAMRFTLYDAATGGSQVGLPVERNNVPVSEGIFSVAIDFGGDAFLGEGRFMEVAVMCTGDADYMALSPRQLIAATPYALYALQVAEHDHWGETWSGSGTGLTLRNGDIGLHSTGGDYGVYGRTTSTGGTAVAGISTATSGTPYGIYGESSSSTGRAVYGLNQATSGLAYGLYGQSESSGGQGVYGYASASSGTTYGVYGHALSSSGRGVYGLAPALSGTTYGVYGLVASSSGRAVYGYATSASGTTYGVYGRSESTDGRGVYGWVDATTGTTYGVYGQADSVSGYGVYGQGGMYGLYGLGTFITGVYGSGPTGVEGRSSDSDGRGVHGYASSTSGQSSGVYGAAASSSGRGVQGYAFASTGTTYGVYGWAESSSGYGVYGSGGGYGVYGSSSGYAGYFAGNVHVAGNLSKAGGAFKIDHPLDPAGKYLYHSFVESPDMLNIYNGNVALGPDGTAWVELPDWFQTLNGEFRYQLTAIGAAAPDLHIARQVQDNRFQIAGGPAGLEVSWQVTGIRHDPWAEAHRIPVEEDKPAEEQGTYLHPELYGQPEELGIEYQHRPPALDR